VNEPATDVVVIPPAPLYESAQPLALSFDPFGFTPLQTIFLIAQAENPLLSRMHVINQLRKADLPAPTVSTVHTWSDKLHFRTAYRTIRQDPREAANFLIAHSEANSVAALRANLTRGGYSANEAAKALLNEARTRRGDQVAQGLWGAIESALR